MFIIRKGKENDFYLLLPTGCPQNFVKKNPGHSHNDFQGQNDKIPGQKMTKIP